MSGKGYGEGSERVFGSEMKKERHGYREVKDLQG